MSVHFGDVELGATVESDDISNRLQCFKAILLVWQICLVSG